MLVFPNAKINIGLNVVEKRKDGFHNLETIFYPVTFSDALEITKGTTSGNKFEFNLTGLSIDSEPDRNLCVRAFQLLSQKFNLPPTHIHLHKVIPMGAGLGGGSSDASFTLKVLNELYQLNIPQSQLKILALELGSDCPFFIDNEPYFAEGRGEIFSPVTIDLKNYYILIINPGLHVSTSDAFKHIVPQKPYKQLKELINEPINLWKDIIKNDFELGIFKLFPAIKQIKNDLYDIGAIYASMSGSGSSVYGIFENPVSFQEKFKNYDCYLQKPTN